MTPVQLQKSLRPRDALSMTLRQGGGARMELGRLGDSLTMLDSRVCGMVDFCKNLCLKTTLLFWVVHQALGSL